MLQRRARREGLFSNAFEKLLEGTTARQRLDALENLQAMSAVQRPRERHSFVAQQPAHIHARCWREDPRHEDSQWHDMRRVTNYFPRNWDADSIRKDEAGFKALLAKKRSTK